MHDHRKAPFLIGDMGVSLNGGTQQPWIFLLKMIILGCFGGTTIFGNTHISTQIVGVPGFQSC